MEFKNLEKLKEFDMGTCAAIIQNMIDIHIENTVSPIQKGYHRTQLLHTFYIQFLAILCFFIFFRICLVFVSY
jgi:hypothetical protein